MTPSGARQLGLSLENASRDPDHGQGVRPGTTWHVDIVPIPVAIGDDPSARSAIGLVVDSTGTVLGVEPLEAVPNELEPIADLMDTLLESAARIAGHSPAMVKVRHPAIRALLAPRLSSRGIAVRSSRTLPALDRARRDFGEKALGLDDLARTSVFMGRWSQWGAPQELIADVFDASAEYYRAEPWEMLTGGDAFDVVIPQQCRWTVLVLGEAGETFGLVLLEQHSDVDRMQRSTTAAGGIAALQGQTVYLTFDHKHDVPRDFRDEVKRNRWRLPAPDVYPVLATINTPAGGVTRGQLHELATILRATAAFSKALPTLIEGQEVPGFWSHSDTAVNFIFNHRELAFALSSRVAGPLAPAGPAGRGAEPLAQLDPDALENEQGVDAPILERFGAWLRQHGDDREAARHASNAELFVSFLTNYHGIPLRAVSEYDLRIFLHDWLHRKVVLPDEDAYVVPESLGLFFQYLAEGEEIVCPWATTVIHDRAMLRQRRETFPGGFFWDPGVEEWRGALGPSLSARALIIEPADSTSVGGVGMMRSVEAKLEAELQRLWLVWRDELVRGGVTDSDAVIAALVERTARWERTPHSTLDGITPRAAVAKERNGHAQRDARIR